MGEIKYLEFQNWLDGMISQIATYRSSNVKISDIKLISENDKISIKVGENTLSTIDLVCE